MSIDLSGMTVGELGQLLETVEAAIVKRKNDDREAVIKKVNELVDNSGFTFSELFPIGQTAVKKTRRTSAVLPRYKDPVTGATWSGRGRKPVWVVKHLEAGGTLDAITIQK